MSGTIATTDIRVRRREHRVLTIILWVLQVLLAFQFVGGGVFKLIGAPEMVAMFTTIGAGQWFRYLVGALEIAGGIGLLIPRLSGVAAFGLGSLLIGATVTNLFILHADPWLPIGFLMVSTLIIWRRWPQIVTFIAPRTR